MNLNTTKHYRGLNLWVPRKPNWACKEALFSSWEAASCAPWLMGYWAVRLHLSQGSVWLLQSASSTSCLVSETQALLPFEHPQHEVWVLRQGSIDGGTIAEEKQGMRCLSNTYDNRSCRRSVKTQPFLSATATMKPSSESQEKQGRNHVRLWTLCSSTDPEALPARGSNIPALRDDIPRIRDA